MEFSSHLHVIDSHTAGEPTRVVVDGGPDLGNGTLQDRLQLLRTEYDSFRSGVVCEPRGSEVVVGALLLQPVALDASAAVIYFNDVGYLGMCGHGTIGLVTTLAHMGQIGPGQHKIETPVGDVSTYLHDDGSVTVNNVPAYRYRTAVAVDVPSYGLFSGDVAWGGNWFFLIGEHPYDLTLENRNKLVAVTTAIRQALQEQGVAGANGETIDHIELFSPPADHKNSSRNFVLCPGASFDRSPCGTGTSAKMACLHAERKLAAGQRWKQEGILGTVFEGSIEPRPDGTVSPSIRGKAWITGESKLLFTSDDPFRDGIRF
jgi:4-hydroxyproline epimerase